MKNEYDQIVFYTPGLYPCKTGGMEIYNYYLINSISSAHPNKKWVVLTSCRPSHVRNINWLPMKKSRFLLNRYGIGTLWTLMYYTLSRKIKLLKLKTIIIIPYTSNFSYKAITFLVFKKNIKSRLCGTYTWRRH